MKFTVERDNLYKALQKLTGATGSNTILPVISNVKIKAANNQLYLDATDLEIRVSTSINAEVAVEGETTAPAKKLASLINSLRGDKVSIEVNEKNFINIICGTGNYVLLGLPAEDFPEEESFESIRKITIAENEFRRMIGQTAYAVSADDSRKILNGGLLNAYDGIVALVATDGKRLAIKESNPESIEGEDGAAVVPFKALSEVKRMLDNTGNIEIVIGEKFCTFQTPNFKLSSKLIEGNYPNYKQVIPSKYETVLEVSRTTLLEMVETLSLVLSGNSSFVVINFTENKLELKAASSEIGEGNDIIDVPYTGPEISMSFNPAFVSEPLKNCDSDNITIKLNNATTPLTIEGEGGFLYVIMPVRKKNA